MRRSVYVELENAHTEVELPTTQVILDAEAKGVEVSPDPFFVRNRLALRVTDALRSVTVVVALSREAEEKLRDALNERNN